MLKQLLGAISKSTFVKNMATKSHESWYKKMGFPPTWSKYVLKCSELLRMISTSAGMSAYMNPKYYCANRYVSGYIYGFTIAYTLYEKSSDESIVGDMLNKFCILVLKDITLTDDDFSIVSRKFLENQEEESTEFLEGATLDYMTHRTS